MGEGHPLGFSNRKAENKEKEDGLSVPIRHIGGRTCGKQQGILYSTQAPVFILFWHSARSVTGEWEQFPTPMAG